MADGRPAAQPTRSPCPAGLVDMLMLAIVDKSMAVADWQRMTR